MCAFTVYSISKCINWETGGKKKKNARLVLFNRMCTAWPFGYFRVSTWLFKILVKASALLKKIKHDEGNPTT